MLKVIRMFVVIIVIVIYAAAKAETGNFYKIIEIPSKAGFPHKVALFAADAAELPKKVVIFIPGNAFNMESWYPFARKFNAAGVSAVAVNVRSYDGIKSTIEYLADNGYKDISLVGASLGGRVMLDVLSENDFPAVSRLIALSPYEGSSIKNNRYKKLFIISVRDHWGIYRAVKGIYADSAEPKRIKELDTAVHAQHLLKGEFAKEVSEAIMQFILE